MSKQNVILTVLVAMLGILMMAQWTVAKAMDLEEVVHHQRDDERRFFRSCLKDTSQWESMYLDYVSKATLTIVCQFAWNYGYKVYFNSTLRGDARQLIGTHPQSHIPYKKSRHAIGMAVDVQFHPQWADGVPLSYKGKLLLYRKNLDDFNNFLIRNKLTRLVTKSCYPNQNGPFIHVDARGKPASWGRLQNKGDQYVSYAACLAWIDKELKENT